MDFYISKFKEFKEECCVLDYAVYLQKKMGFDRFNPFSANTQIVIHITNQGVFCQKIDGSGEFDYPLMVTPIDLQFDMSGKFVKIPTLSSKIYKFTRKMKQGKFSNHSDFSKAITTVK